MTGMYAATRGELIAEIGRLVAVIDAFEAGLLDIVAGRGRAQSIAAELIVQAVAAGASKPAPS